MKIGFKEVVINPEFEVYRMKKKNGKHLACHDDLHCRILCIEKDGEKPWYHFSIDTVEIWRYYVERMQRECEEVLKRKINLTVSATHTHNACDCTYDSDYRDFLMNKIKENITTIEMHQYEKLEYAYSYRYYNKMGDSREAGGFHKAVHLYAECLSFYGDGARVGTVLIHNCHPTVKELWCDDFTAEYPGYIIRKLKEEHPNEFFTFMLGPAGDISPNRVRRERTFAEIERLGDLLVEEYDWHLANQKSLLKPVDKFVYREKVLPVERIIPPFSNLTIPPLKRLVADEKEILNRKINPSRIMPPKDAEEYVTEHVFSQLILNQDYSIIFEPFELYSEYYGAVNKNTTSIVSISNGFDHYLTGLYINHVVLHGLECDIGPQMKKDIWELYGKWSDQQECDTF